MMHVCLGGTLVNLSVGELDCRKQRDNMDVTVGTDRLHGGNCIDVSWNASSYSLAT